MSEAKHTPGPWEVVVGSVFTKLGAANAAGVNADKNDGWQIADCSGGLTSVAGELTSLEYAEQVANAHLIAAATEMLEALQNSQKLIDQLMPASGSLALQDYEFVNQTMVANRAAIAKAKGETK